jgi:hypothetical protein
MRSYQAQENNVEDDYHSKAVTIQQEKMFFVF